MTGVLLVGTRLEAKRRNPRPGPALWPGFFQVLAVVPLRPRRSGFFALCSTRSLLIPFIIMLQRKWILGKITK